MDDNAILELVKFNLGLTTDVRDKYLLQIIKSTRSQLKQSGIDPEGQSEDYCNEYYYYLSDEAAWLYRNRGGEIALSEGLRFRRNNLIIGHEDV